MSRKKTTCPDRDLPGPLPWIPNDHGDYIPRSEIIRRQEQAEAERRRLMESLGWWEDPPAGLAGLAPLEGDSRKTSHPRISESHSSVSTG